MSVKDPDKFDADTYISALEHDTHRTAVRWITIAIAVVLVVMISGVTYCGSRPSERMQCVTAGGSWMPVITGHDGNGEAMYDDACVRPGMASIVPKGETK